MGAVKELFTAVEESLERGNYAEALELLKPWGSDAPNQLWGVIEMLAAYRLDEAQDLPRKKYTGHIFIEEFIIKAQNQEDAERIYHDYHAGLPCRIHFGIVVGQDDCDCFELWEEVGHTMEEWDINE